MNQFNYYRIFFTPLSPVHIGTGDSYEPTNYVIEDGGLYEFDTGTAMGILSQQERAELSRITAGQPSSRMVQAIQRFFYDRRSRLLSVAVNRVLVSNGVAALYRDRIGQVAQREARGREILNALEVARTAYNPISRQPTLMGSSLKGAIRTALLDQLNNGRTTPETNGLHPFQGKRDLFRYSQPRLELERDPMRLVHISDASWRGDPESPAAEVFFAANVKKTPVADQKGQRRPTRAESSGPPQILECIPCFRYRAFGAQLNIQRVDTINQPGSLPDPDLRFDMRRIASACNGFYQPILQEELRVLASAGYLENPWYDAVKKVLEDARLKNGDAFLLRVGRHCGAESVTLRGVRNIRIMGGRGQAARFRDSATTMWLAARERGQTTGLFPFGWTFVEFYPLDGGPVDENASLKNVCTVAEKAMHARSESPPPRRAPRQKAETRQITTTRPSERPPKSQQTMPSREEAAFTPVEQTWDNATITRNPGNGEVVATSGNQRAFARGKAAAEFLSTLTEQQRGQLVERRKELTNVKVVVEIYGNQSTLKRLA